ncbi:MAG: ubiquinone/menaquinone biosynthesis methyltransferase [Candidatus Micrarchaeia archaeon]
MSNNVNQMFSSISANYDRLNKIISFGLDKKWRKLVASECLKDKDNIKILDAATGTAELALSIVKLAEKQNKNVDIIGIDFNNDMLAIANEKIKRNNIKNINLINGDILYTNFPNGEFDVVTSAFALRNVDNLKMFIEETYRILKDNGYIVFLDVAKPSAILNKLFKFYYFYIIPMIGAKYNKNAYLYLVNSLWAFEKDKLIDILVNANFKDIKIKNLTLGAAFMLIAKKG